MKLRLKGNLIFETQSDMDSFLTMAENYKRGKKVTIYTVIPAEDEPGFNLYLDVAFEKDIDTQTLFDNIKLRDKLGITKIYLTTHQCRIDGTDTTTGNISDVRSYTWQP